MKTTGYLGRAPLDSTPHGQSVSKGAGLQDDSAKNMGHDLAKHMPKVAGAAKTDHKKTTEGHIGAANLGKNLASNTTFPYAKSYGNPKEK